MSNQKNNFDLLFKKIFDETGYTFTDPTILKDFKKHERLEFLGDTVLHLFLTQNLYKNLPKANEHELHIKRQFIECNKNLSLIFDSFDFQKYGFPEKKKKYNKFKKQETTKMNLKVKADNIEVIIGAIYEDSGYDLRKIECCFMNLFQHSFEQVCSEDTFDNIVGNLESNKNDINVKIPYDETKLFTFEEVQEIVENIRRLIKTNDFACQTNFNETSTPVIKHLSQNLPLSRKFNDINSYDNSVETYNCFNEQNTKINNIISDDKTTKELSKNTIIYENVNKVNKASFDKTFSISIFNKENDVNDNIEIDESNFNFTFKGSGSNYENINQFQSIDGEDFDDYIDEKYIKEQKELYENIQRQNLKR